MESVRVRASVRVHIVEEGGQEGLTHLDIVTPTFFNLLLASREIPMCSYQLKSLIH